MPAPYSLTSWAHRTCAMCKGTLKLVESDFSIPTFKLPTPASCVNLLLSLTGDIDDFLPGKISVLKYTAIIKNIIGAKNRSPWE